MNNAPFSIGQKVVCISVPKSPWTKLVKGNIYTVLNVECCPKCGAWYIAYSPADGDETDNDCSICDAYMPLSGYRSTLPHRFAPIQTQYNDATAEILEKFKQTSETPDKIIVPQTETA